MAKSHEDIVKEISQLVRGALRARLVLVVQGSDGVEYEATTIRERLMRDDIKADLSALRVGRYFSDFTQFTLLQWLDGAIQDIIEGKPVRADPATIDSD